MRPFTQGTVDTFCAAYAVLNALRITHNLKPVDGRNLITKLLLTLARDEIVFKRVLTLKTNYVAMTDVFLEMCAKEYPIRVTKPFVKPPQNGARRVEACTKNEFWTSLESFLDPDKNKTAIFQFEKRLPLSANSIFAHWTTAWAVEGNELRLFDCSPEENSVKILYKDKIALVPRNEGVGEYICVNPPTIRLIELI